MTELETQDEALPDQQEVFLLVSTRLSIFDLNLTGELSRALRCSESGVMKRLIEMVSEGSLYWKETEEDGPLFLFNFDWFAKAAPLYTMRFFRKHARRIRSIADEDSFFDPTTGWLDFLKAVARYNDEKKIPTEKVFRELLPAHYDAARSSRRLRLRLAASMLIDKPEWVPFFKNFPDSGIIQIFWGFKRRLDRDSPEVLERARGFFRAFTGDLNTRAEIENWLFLQGEYFKTGWKTNPLRHINKAAGEAGGALRTLSALGRGDCAKAASAMLDTYRYAADGDQCYFFDSNFMNDLLGAALYLDRGTEKTAGRIGVLSRRISAYGDEDVTWLLLQLLEKAQDPAFEPVIDYGEMEDRMHLDFVSACFSLCIVQRMFPNRKSAELLRRALAEKDALTPFIRCEILSALDPKSDEAAALQKELGSLPVLHLLEAKPVWELGLEKLRAAANAVAAPKKPGKAEKPERIIYEVDTDYFTVSPFTERSRDGVVWSGTKPLPMKKFAAGLPCMDETDRRLSELVPPGSRYPLSGAEPLLELAGCPRVFTRKQGSLVPITVERQRLTVSVTRSKAEEDEAAFEIHTNLDSFEGKCREFGGYICRYADDTVYIYERNERDSSILEALKSVRSVPAGAKDTLTEILENLSSAYEVSSDLLADSASVRSVNASETLVYQIEPNSAGDLFTVRSFIRPFAGCEKRFIPGEGLAATTMKTGGETVCLIRNLEAEKANAAKMEEVLEAFTGMKEEDALWRLTLPECLDFMEAVRGAGGIASVEWPEGAKFNVSHRPIDFEDLELKVSSLGHWFTLDGAVSVDGATQLKVNEILDKLNDSVGRFIRLSDTEFVAVSQKLRKHLESLQKVAEDKKGRLRLSVFNSEVIEGLEGEGAAVKTDKAYKTLRKNIQDAEERDFAVPDALNADLRAYQAEGFEWMARLAHWGAGAVLSDDMGLGKTVQTIALLLARRKAGPSLVVLPTAVLFNWKRELERFAPSLRVADFNQADREALLSDLSETDVVLVTYGVMTSEIEKLSEVAWNVVVLDEAHTIKNRLTQTSKAVMKLKSSARVLLSGTPIQNHLSEIWNLFEFANPGLLGSYQQFGERFIVPIEKFRNKDAQSLLKRIISPFILRRTKSDVLEELPEKTELTVPVTLTEAEMAVYENIRTKTMEGLENGDINPIEALSALTKLRQAACHPRLVNPKLALPSSKSAVFMALAEDLIENKHRVLVFSQFTSHLALIREELDAKKIPYLYLDGSHTAGQRKKLVEEFQGGDAPLFLISLKAGGLGLNLTGADYVIHLDPWWNPAVEDQASDRAYRIGQKRPVTIYKLIASNTIEEKIIDLHTTKKNLADALLEGADVAKKLTREEILGLLQAANG